MAKVEIKSKEAKMKAAMSGGKAKRKKWSKGKVREKLQNAVQFDQKVLDRMLVEVPKVGIPPPSLPFSPHCSPAMLLDFKGRNPLANPHAYYFSLPPPHLFLHCII